MALAPHSGQVIELVVLGCSTAAIDRPLPVRPPPVGNPVLRVRAAQRDPGIAHQFIDAGGQRPGCRVRDRQLRQLRLMCP